MRGVGEVIKPGSYIYVYIIISVCMYIYIYVYIESHPEGDRILWGIWGSYCHIPKAIFYPLKGDYTV